MKLLVKTLSGLEDVLSEELKELGAQQVQKRKRAVACEGDLQMMYKINMHVRTALRVLVPIYEFEARSEKELYDRIYEHDWSQYLGHNDTFAIDNTVFSKFFNHTKYAALKSKDAIVDQFRNKFGARPSVNIESPNVLFNLHVFHEKFSVSLDSSGKPLNQRGYRGKGHQAPLNEVLAAGMVMMSGWTPDMSLLDPMCGTGTILTEAAMIAWNMPPNLKRNDFGFKSWKNFEPMMWHRVKMDAESQVKKRSIHLNGLDIDPSAVSNAKRAFKAMDFGREVSVRQLDFFRYTPTIQGKGMIISNPPYGERIGENIEEFYQKLGDHLKQYFTNHSAWLLSSNKNALRNLRLKPEQKIHLYNGALECEFCEYKLF